MVSRVYKVFLKVNLQLPNNLAYLNYFLNVMKTDMEI